MLTRVALMTLSVVVAIAPRVEAAPPANDEEQVYARVLAMAEATRGPAAVDRQMARTLVAGWLLADAPVRDTTVPLAAMRARSDLFASRRLADRMIRAYVEDSPQLHRRFPVLPITEAPIRMPQTRGFQPWFATERARAAAEAGAFFTRHLARGVRRVAGHLLVDQAGELALLDRLVALGEGQVTAACRELRQGERRSRCVAEERARAYLGVAVSRREALALDAADAALDAALASAAVADDTRRAIEAERAHVARMRATLARSRGHANEAEVRDALLLVGPEAALGSIEAAQRGGPPVVEGLQLRLSEIRRFPGDGPHTWLLIGDLPTWVLLGRPYASSGPRTDRRSSAELRVYRDRILDDGFDPPNVLFAAGREPLTDLALTLTLGWERPAELVRERRHASDAARWEALGARGQRPQVRILFGLRNIQTLPAADLPLSGYALAIEGAALRLERVTELPIAGLRAAATKDEINFGAEVLATATLPAPTAATLAVTLRLEGREVTAEVGGAVLTATLDEPPLGFIGFEVLGTGYAAIIAPALTPRPTR